MRSFLQYKHMRRCMEVLENTFLEHDPYKQFRRTRQENDYWIKQSFQKTPCMDPYKEYKLIRQCNEFQIKY